MVAAPSSAAAAADGGDVVGMELFHSIEDDTPSPTSQTNQLKRQRFCCCCCRPAWCGVFVCFSPEHERSSTLWKIICWIKIIIIALSYFLCLYFVIVCIGATHQISSTRSKLPAVREALYKYMDEGPVCAFDNRGPE